VRAKRALPFSASVPISALMLAMLAQILWQKA